jgi:hypothetical protein
MDYATVPRDEFNEQLEIGVPIDNPSDKQGQNEVLILYTDEKTLPDDDKNKKGSKAKDIGPKIGVATEHALQNCHTVRVILQEPSKGSKNGKRQCIGMYMFLLYNIKINLSIFTLELIQNFISCS